MMKEKLIFNSMVSANIVWFISRISQNEALLRERNGFKTSTSSTGTRKNELEILRREM